MENKALRVLKSWKFLSSCRRWGARLRADFQRGYDTNWFSVDFQPEFMQTFSSSVKHKHNRADWLSAPLAGPSLVFVSDFHSGKPPWLFWNRTEIWCAGSLRPRGRASCYLDCKKLLVRFESFKRWRIPQFYLVSTNFKLTSARFRLVIIRPASARCLTCSAAVRCFSHVSAWLWLMGPFVSIFPDLWKLKSFSDKLLQSEQSTNCWAWSDRSQRITSYPFLCNEALITLILWLIDIKSCRRLSLFQARQCTSTVTYCETTCWHLFKFLFIIMLRL